MSRVLAPDIRQHVFLIFKEAVNNAFKYSNGDSIEVRLSRSPKEGLSMSIRDNGRVDPSTIKTTGVGLCNIVGWSG